jgi:hypothetical protein
MTAAAKTAADSRAVAAVLGLKVAGLLHPSVVHVRDATPLVFVYVALLAFQLDVVSSPYL